MVLLTMDIFGTDSEALALPQPWQHSIPTPENSTELEKNLDESSKNPPDSRMIVG